MSPTASGGSNARKSEARDLAARTGMKYTAALATVTRSDPPRQPRARWQLTEEVRDFFGGVGWHGVGYPDLYEWLDGLDPRFECDWCAEPADADVQECSIQLVVTRYDPDRSPRTEMLGVNKHHAACRPSGVSWLVPAGQFDPHHLALPASVRPDIAGEYVIDAWPLLYHDNGGPLPVLVVIATVVEDHGQGAGCWLTELEMWLRDHGFTTPDMDEDPEDDDGPQGWALRIETASSLKLTPRWLALRTGPATLGAAPGHFFLGGVDGLDDNWVAAAHSRGRVLVYAGPLPAYGQAPELPEKIDADALDELMENGLLLAGMVPLAADHEHAPEGVDR